ncbi:MAG TPA: metallophosphoesterase, partial [Sphingobacteriaceae bacterium]
MNRALTLVVIGIIMLIIDYYIEHASRPIRARWTKKNQRLFIYFWWGWTALLLVGVFGSILLNARLAIRSVLLVAFFITFVSKLVYLPFLFLDEIRRVFIWLFRKARPAAEPVPGDRISRSEFLVKAGIAVAAIPLSSLSWGIVSGAYDYQLVRRKLFLRDLPRAFDGMKIAQISDVHSGSFYDRKAVLGGIEMILGQKPDMIFFTGDLVNNMASEMKDYQDLFSKLKAPLGTYSVLGNHDYGEYHFGKGPSAAKARNLQDLIGTHKRMGWDLL